MFGDLFSPRGKVLIVKTLQHTNYFWGDISEISGKYIWLMEQNKQGDCLCLVDNKGLVDVDHRDIEKIWDFNSR